MAKIQESRIMLVKNKVCVVTGAASGIGAAVARAYAERGARGVVVADLKSSRDRLAKVAGHIDGLAVTADVGQEEDIKALIAAAEDKYGPVDIFFPMRACRARDRRAPTMPTGT
jgi:NAD(P)-dependent dehydrogenase (short-subunit alcohol dehydrogenase family)